jgi:hypothetical protein
MFRELELPTSVKFLDEVQKNMPDQNQDNYLLFEHRMFQVLEQ